MIKVNDIPINFSTVEGKKQGELDFSSVDSIKVDDYIYISANNDILELTSSNDVTTEKWLDWIVANYNYISESFVASRSGSKLIITSNENNDFDINLDLSGESE